MQTEQIEKPEQKPTEWKAVRERGLKWQVVEGGRIIASSIHETDARFIAQAANSHDALVSALERARGCINRLASGKPERELGETLGEIESALKAAKGE